MRERGVEVAHLALLYFLLGGSEVHVSRKTILPLMIRFSSIDAKSPYLHV